MSITAVLTNRTRAPVSWGIWSNTRVPPMADVLVPVAGNEHVRCEASVPVEAPRWFCADGWLELAPPKNTDRSNGKLFITPSQSLIAMFAHDLLLLKTGDLTCAEKTAPGHSPVELYRSLGGTPTEDILELEMHGPRTCIAPGESTLWTETWHIRPCAGAKTREDRIAVLEHCLSGG